MNLSFVRIWWVIAGVLALVPGKVAAQQGFSERPGDWEVTGKFDATSEPVVQRFCLTNETWTKALTRLPAGCQVQDLAVTAGGIHYTVDCELKMAQIKGRTDIAFDGLERMTGKSTITTTARGTSTTSVVVSDYRWKGAACTAADVNTKKKGGD
jgi:hypothetical protein